MVSSSILRNASRPSINTCAICSLHATQTVSRTSRRHIGLKWLAKKDEAEKQWQEQAKEIRAGNKKSMLTVLEERGLVHQMTADRDQLNDLLIDKRVGAYVGVDPTASSLHVGHLLPFMSIFWMYLHGYHAVSLLGGATAKIGDPTGRLTSRPKEAAAVRTANMVNMHYQMKKLWLNVEMMGRKYGYNWEWAWHRELVNNNAWMNKLGVLELLQILGPGMRMGTMMSRDTVKNKMKSGDGMSYAEFTYPILQAWDWWHMFNTKGISMQIGGADQYGNIIAGQEAVKYVAANHPDPSVRNDHVGKVPMGFTVPLLTTAAGEKFGKSAGNAVWLDKELTSCYDLYGFFLRQADADMPRFLRFFTFMPIAEIDALVEEHNREPHLRLAQHKLASEFLELVHGPEEMKIAAEQHRMIHGEPLTIQSLLEPARVDPKNAHITMNSAPIKRMKLPESLILNKSIGRITHAAGLATSASEGHRLAEKGGLYIGAAPGQKKAMDGAELKFTPIRNWYVEDTRKFLIEDKLLILRKGKNLVKIVEVVSDEEWKESGETYPGEALGGPDMTHASEATENKSVGEIKEERSQNGKKKSLWSQFAPEREERVGRPREKVDEGGNAEWSPFLRKVKTKGTPVESSEKPEEKTLIRKIQSEGKWALPSNKAAGDKW